MYCVEVQAVRTYGYQQIWELDNKNKAFFAETNLRLLPRKSYQIVFLHVVSCPSHIVYKSRSLHV